MPKIGYLVLPKTQVVSKGKKTLKKKKKKTNRGQNYIYEEEEEAVCRIFIFRYVLVDVCGLMYESDENE